MTEPNENEYTRNGVRYVAEDEPTESCANCAFRRRNEGCIDSPHCVAKHRTDKRSIIWVVAK